MHNRTKRHLLRAATTAAVACAAALIFLPAAASAASATTSGATDVYSRPGGRVVDHLAAGTTVDVGGCRQGWCYITSPERGFVGANALRSGGAALQPNFNLNFNFPQGSFSIGTGGVSIGVGTPPPPPPPPGHGPGPGGPGGPGHGGPGHGGPGHGGPGDHDHGGPGPGGSNVGDVCFYTQSGYDGMRLCVDRGDRIANLPRGFDNRISSIRNRRGLEVTVCRDPGYRNCRVYTTSASSLGSFSNAISSIRVR